MSWDQTNSKLLSVSSDDPRFSNFNVVVKVLFKNNETGQEHTQEFKAHTLTPDEIIKNCQQVVDFLNSRDSRIIDIQNAFKNSDGIFKDQPIPKPPPPDEETILQKQLAEEFFGLQTKTRQLKIAVEQGFLKPDNTDLVSLQAELDARFKEHPEYALDPRWR